MSKFSEKIIEVTRIIPKGTVCSYGQVALMAGVPRGARQVGWILHDYSDKYNLPWWRVINNGGRISTKCPEHTANVQKQYLEAEGVKVGKGLSVDIEKYRFRPNREFIENLKLDDEYIFLLNHKYL